MVESMFTKLDPYTIAMGILILCTRGESKAECLVQSPAYGVKGECILRI